MKEKDQQKDFFNMITEFLQIESSFTCLSYTPTQSLKSSNYRKVQKAKTLTYLPELRLDE